MNSSSDIAFAGIPCILALGSNLGDRRAHLEAGLRGLAERIRITGVSRLAESDPWGPVQQGPFLNLLVRGETEGSPQEVLALALEVEREAGRLRTGVRYGPRTLDIDLLFHGSSLVHEPDLEVPHPRWRERPFVWGLLSDVGEGMWDPMSGVALSESFPPGTPLPTSLREVPPLPFMAALREMSS